MSDQTRRRFLFTSGTATAVLGLRFFAWANFSEVTATRPWRTSSCTAFAG